MKKYTHRHAQQDLPARKRTDNKTRGGKCLVVAGSKGLWGAGILCAQAASRIGAGYVYLYGNAKNFPLLKNPDFLWFNSLQAKANSLNMFSAIALGPGFLDKALLKKVILRLRKQSAIPVVLDAEAFKAISSLQGPLPSHWILTPHEGELARLLKVSSRSVQQNRKKYLLMAQKKWGCIVLLKGFQTLVATPQSLFQIQSGNPSLAKAGTGDVLTGIILGLLSQKIPPIKAACLGAFVHGFVADQWIRSGNDVLSLMASDLVSGLPQALRSIRKD